tara:strand:+ start:284 stop:433 length:150 start_codon:yes stop_codon:yes gene_type:complete
MYICAKSSPSISLPIMSLGINVAIVNKTTIIKKNKKIMIKILFFKNIKN